MIVFIHFFRLILFVILEVSFCGQVYANEIPLRIDRVEPNIAKEEDTILIFGAGFTTPDSGSLRVTVGGVPCRISDVGPEVIACEVGKIKYMGPQDVIVGRGNGVVVALVNGFRLIRHFDDEVLPAPEVISISPSRGLSSGDSLVLIRGANFREGVHVSIGGVRCAYPIFLQSELACVTIPMPPGIVDVEVTNLDGQKASLPQSFTIESQSDGSPDLIPLSTTWLTNHPELYTSVDFHLLGSTLESRLFRGPPVFEGYNLLNIIDQLQLKVPIRSFGSLDPLEVRNAKERYLAQPEIQDIPFSRVRHYFNRLFPQSEQFPDGQALPENDPYFLSPADLVDFSHDGPDSLPLRIGPDGTAPNVSYRPNLSFSAERLPEEWGWSDQTSIAGARVNIEKIITFAELGNGYNRMFNRELDEDWRLDLQFNLKKILVRLNEGESNGNTNPEEVKLAVRVLVSAGAHCGPGVGEAAQIIRQIFFKGKTDWLEPVTVAEKIISRLDQFREEVFLRVVSFVVDRQTAHTKNFWRNFAGPFISLGPGMFDPHQGVGIHFDSREDTLDLATFLNRFFYGKNRSPMGLEPEQRRGYRGYSLTEIVKVIIQYLGLDTREPRMTEEISALFSEDLSSDQIKYVLKLPESSSILKKLAYMIAEDCPTETQEAQNGCVDRVVTGFPEDHLRRSYIEAKYFIERQNRFYLTEDGIRNLLLRVGVFE